MKYLCERDVYTQSDEITLVLIDYQKLTTDAWFDYNVQKMCSVLWQLLLLTEGFKNKSWNFLIMES